MACSLGLALERAGGVAELEARTQARAEARHHREREGGEEVVTWPAHPAHPSRA